jgi:hypothetical protein
MELSAFLSTLAFLLLSTLIGIVISQNKKQSEDQAEVKDAVNGIKVEQATMNATVNTVVKRVDDLHAWKNIVQEREAVELRKTIEQMRRERQDGAA